MNAEKEAEERLLTLLLCACLRLVLVGLLRSTLPTLCLSHDCRRSRPDKRFFEGAGLCRKQAGGYFARIQALLTCSMFRNWAEHAAFLFSNF